MPMEIEGKDHHRRCGDGSGGFMEERIPLGGRESISLIAGNLTSSAYPSSRIQKGLALAWEDRDLSEEGVGFGVPVFRVGLETIFAGGSLSWTREDGKFAVLRVDYEMNLISRMARKGRKIKRKIAYRVRERLSSLHRKHPGLRGVFMSASQALRRAFLLEDVFEEIPSAGLVRAVYTIEGCSIHVDLKIQRKERGTEVIVMNEQGANYFDLYYDSDGLRLQGKEISSWEETFADEASFVNSQHRIAFTLGKAQGARMFRGRELATERLAWAGLAYVLPGNARNFAYTIRIGGI
jgi:hypothetical protein